MKILLRDTDMDGQPIIGSGLLINGKDAEEIVAKMQYSSPFNPGDVLAYMRHVLDVARAEEALPKQEDEPAASEFLERLAQCGLVEFIKEEPSEAASPEQLEKALLAVRDSGLTNMLDYAAVARLAREFGFPAVADWIEAHPTDYTRLLLRGEFRPLRDNFIGKEVPHPDNAEPEATQPETRNRSKATCAD